MSTPCGIFWDYGNIEIPKKLSADDVNFLIRSKIIDVYDLVRKDYYIVGDCQTIKQATLEKFLSFGATFENVLGKEAADTKIIKRVADFIDIFQQKCTIILITGDLDIGKPLRDYLPNDLLKIYFVRLENCFSEKLISIADRIFVLKPSKSLELVYSKPQSSIPNSLPNFTRKYFVMIESDRYFTPRILDGIRNDLSTYGGSFAILTDDDVIWCLFDEISDARSALNLKGKYNYNSSTFSLDVNVQKPSLKVNNLMMCAKLSNRPLVKNRRETLIMPQYKVNSKDHKGYENTEDQGATNDLLETLNNVAETFNTVQSIYSSLKSTNTRPSNSRSNNDDCRQS